ncbi:MAG: hypothetical protein IKR23_13030 [Lachnospiraceae bacterium]|nr:hypothetical protein [Lachnospiraceae bacterium]
METIFLYLSCAMFALIISLTINFTLVLLSRKEKQATENEMISGTFPEFYLKDPRMEPSNENFIKPPRQDTHFHRKI